jgi:hypothetical protein
VGRRHLILLAWAAAALAAAAPGSSASIRWTELQRGEALLTQLISPVVLVASDRDTALPLTSGLPQKAVDALLHVDYKRNVVVGVFGPFGCRDNRIVVRSIARQGQQLLVTLATRPAAAGAKKCRDKTVTYRLLVLPKKEFQAPYPRIGDVKFARA